jgi:hypothetical protein
VPLNVGLASGFGVAGFGVEGRGVLTALMVGCVEGVCCCVTTGRVGVEVTLLAGEFAFGFVFETFEFDAVLPASVLATACSGVGSGEGVGVASGVGVAALTAPEVLC